jgi:hypothetical protein
MATDLVERVSPKLHGLSDSAGKATSDVAGVWRDRGAPAAAAAMTTMREKAAPAAKKAVKEHAVPAAIAAGITVRDRAKPIAIAVYGSMSERAGNMRDRMADSDVAAAQRVTMAKAARQAAAATKPHRDEAGRRIRAMQRAAAGHDMVETKRRGIPLLLLVFLVGAAAGAVASAFARRNPPESYSGGFQESLNGVHGSETQPAETSKESNS